MLGDISNFLKAFNTYLWSCSPLLWYGARAVAFYFFAPFASVLKMYSFNKKKICFKMPLHAWVKHFKWKLKLKWHFLLFPPCANKFKHIKWKCIQSTFYFPQFIHEMSNSIYFIHLVIYVLIDGSLNLGVYLNKLSIPFSFWVFSYCFHHKVCHLMSELWLYPKTYATPV